jgi:competence protein ComEA
MMILCVVILLMPNISSASEAEEVITPIMININTAGKDELMELKGIGPKLADRIIEYREQNGPFVTVDDILKVNKIGAKFLDENRTMMTIEGTVEGIEEEASGEIEESAE